jgi:hypothetical protein
VIRERSSTRRLILGVAAACLIGLVCLGIVAAALALRGSNTLSLAGANPQALFQGITYEQVKLQTPRPVVAHILRIDLRAEGIGFLVTPGDAGQELPLSAKTTSQFLEDFKVQMAVNGDGFTPWHSNGPLDYYPHPGDRVKPNGMAASRGGVYSAGDGEEPVLYLSRTNQARFNVPFGKIYNAISGDRMLVERGGLAQGLDSQPQPRTAIALDRRGRTLILIVVDGRQAGYSEGMTLEELGRLIVQEGGYYGMNLDGGGSSTMIAQGSAGTGVVLNSPIDQNVRGKERAVGNHLGIFASPLSEAGKRGATRRVSE